MGILFHCGQGVLGVLCDLKVNDSILQEQMNYLNIQWSGREDLNLRPSEPHSDTLPSCATPRHTINYYHHAPQLSRTMKNKECLN
jgi:hypothetical protein